MAEAFSTPALPFEPIVDHVRMHQSDTCEKCINFKTLEQKQALNNNKLRFKSVQQTEGEDTKLVVLSIIRCLPNFQNFDDILHCQRVVCWEDPTDHPMDIVVTFTTKDARDAIYDQRAFIAYFYGMVDVLDELIPERASIFCRAQRYYGAINVTIIDGGVYLIRTYGYGSVAVYLMEELNAILESKREKDFKREEGRRFQRAIARIYQARHSTATAPYNRR